MATYRVLNVSRQLGPNIYDAESAALADAESWATLGDYVTVHEISGTGPLTRLIPIKMFNEPIPAPSPAQRDAWDNAPEPETDYRCAHGRTMQKGCAICTANARADAAADVAAKEGRDAAVQCAQCAGCGGTFNTAHHAGPFCWGCVRRALKGQPLASTATEFERAIESGMAFNRPGQTSSHFEIYYNDKGKIAREEIAYADIAKHRAAELARMFGQPVAIDYAWRDEHSRPNLEFIAYVNPDGGMAQSLPNYCALCGMPSETFVWDAELGWVCNQ